LQNGALLRTGNRHSEANLSGVIFGDDMLTFNISGRMGRVGEQKVKIGQIGQREFFGGIPDNGVEIRIRVQCQKPIASSLFLEQKDNLIRLTPGRAFTPFLSTETLPSQLALPPGIIGHGSRT
jgi:hypothetical protein